MYFCQAVPKKVLWSEYVASHVTMVTLTNCTVTCLKHKVDGINIWFVWQWLLSTIASEIIIKEEQLAK